jgi:hypothetical protein
MAAPRELELAEVQAPVLSEKSLGLEIQVARALEAAWGGGACVRDGVWAVAAFSSVSSTGALSGEEQVRGAASVVAAALCHPPKVGAREASAAKEASAVQTSSRQRRQAPCPQPATESARISRKLNPLPRGVLPQAFGLRRVGGSPPSSLPPAPRSDVSPPKGGTKSVTAGGGDIGVREETPRPAPTQPPRATPRCRSAGHRPNLLDSERR